MDSGINENQKVKDSIKLLTEEDPLEDIEEPIKRRCR